jgi:type VI secretion system protein VasD
MKRRVAMLSIAGLSGLVVVSACSSKPPPPPPPTTLSIGLTAAPDVNPDGAGAAAPLRVRIMQLADTGALSQADFFVLDADPAKALGPDLLGTQDLVLKPAQTMTVTPEAKPDVKFIAVVGAYYAIEKARWRAWVPVKPHVANTITVKLNGAEIDMAEAGP